MRWLLALLALLGLSFFLFAQEPAADATADVAKEPVTVIFVRHAETSGDTSGGGAADPKLSEQGQERAARLARLFGQAGITQIYSSEFERTQATVRPLAKALGVKPQIVGAREAEEQLEQLRELPAGTTALVCGHSNTTPNFVRALGGSPTRLEEHPRAGMLIPHGDYGRIYVVTLPVDAKGKAKMLELNY